MWNVFVYGTLMKERSNNRLLVKQECIGKGLLKGYEMYEVNECYPGIVPCDNGVIMGEVYQIDNQTLKTLDRFEADGNLYIRKFEKVIVNDQEIKAFVYVWNRSVKGCKKVLEMPWKE